MTEPTTLVCKQSFASPAALYLASLSRGASRTTQSRALISALRVLSPGASIDSFSWHRIDVGALLMLRERLAVRMSNPDTANRHLGAVKSVLRAAWRMGLLSSDELARLCDVPGIRGKRLPRRRRALTQQELVRLLDAARQGRHRWTCVRDVVMVAIFYAAGLRRAELGRLGVDDVRFEDDGTIRLRVIGKGNKERDVWISGEIRPLLDAWYAERGTWRGVLFPAKRGSKRPLCSEAITHRINDLGERAGIGHVTPHDLRRTCFTTLLDAGVDLVVVKDIAGHESITTTAKYDLRGERAVRNAAGKLPIPFG